jgi:hypothetical protein
MSQGSNLLLTLPKITAKINKTLQDLAGKSPYLMSIKIIQATIKTMYPVVETSSFITLSYFKLITELADQLTIIGVY